MNTLLIIGSGRYEKICQGCKKQFRTDGRNARFGPPELCSCLERRAKNRLKRKREKRLYHKNPEYHREHSRIRAEARKAMDWHLRSNDLEPQCAYPGCKHKGWEFWRGILQVHHTHGGDLPLNPQSDGNGGWKDVLCFLQVVCRSHHGLYDHCTEKSQLPVLRVPEKEPFTVFLARVRSSSPKRYFLTPTSLLFKEWLDA